MKKMGVGTADPWLYTVLSPQDQLPLYRRRGLRRSANNHGEVNRRHQRIVIDIEWSVQHILLLDLGIPCPWIRHDLRW